MLKIVTMVTMVTMASIGSKTKYSASKNIDKKS